MIDQDATVAQLTAAVARLQAAVAARDEALLQYVRADELRQRGGRSDLVAKGFQLARWKALLAWGWTCPTFEGGWSGP